MLHIHSLQVLFGKNLGKALQIVDCGGVFCLQGQPSGRQIFHVRRGCVGDEEGFLIDDEQGTQRRRRVTWLCCCVEQVQAGSSSELYLVFPSSYCECQAFQFDVLSKQELLLVSFGGAASPAGRGFCCVSMPFVVCECAFSGPRGT